MYFQFFAVDCEIDIDRYVLLNTHDIVQDGKGRNSVILDLL